MKVTANGHLRRYFSRTSRRKRHRARTRWLANSPFPRYFPFSPSLSLVSQNPILRSLGKGWIREIGELAPQGMRQGRVP